MGVFKVLIAKWWNTPSTLDDVIKITMEQYKKLIKTDYKIYQIKIERTFPYLLNRKMWISILQKKIKNILKRCNDKKINYHLVITALPYSKKEKDDDIDKIFNPIPKKYELCFSTKGITFIYTNGVTYNDEIRIIEERKLAATLMHEIFRIYTGIEKFHEKEGCANSFWPHDTGTHFENTEYYLSVLEATYCEECLGELFEYSL